MINNYFTKWIVAFICFNLFGKESISSDHYVQLVKSESVLASKHISTKKSGFDLTKISEVVKFSRDSRFRNISASEQTKFNYYGESTSSFFDKKLMVNKLASRALDTKAPQKEFYIVDVGAGSGAFGSSIYDYVHSYEFFKFRKDNHIPDDIIFYIVSVVGEGGKSSITSGIYAHHYYIKKFKVEEIDAAFTKLDPADFKSGGPGAYELPQDKIKERVDKIKNIHNKVDWALSSWCFIHLADPLGTFKRIFDLLRPAYGMLEVDGFHFITAGALYEDFKSGPGTSARDLERHSKYSQDLITCLVESGEPFLLRNSNHEKLMSVLIKRSSRDELYIPLQYSGSVMLSARNIIANDECATYKINGDINLNRGWINDPDDWKEEQDEIKVLGINYSFFAECRDSLMHNIMKWHSIEPKDSVIIRYNTVQNDERVRKFDYLNMVKSYYDSLELRAPKRRFFDVSSKEDRVRYIYSFLNAYNQDNSLSQKLNALENLYKALDDLEYNIGYSELTEIENEIAFIFNNIKRYVDKKQRDENRVIEMISPDTRRFLPMLDYINDLKNKYEGIMKAADIKSSEFTDFRDLRGLQNSITGRIDRSLDSYFHFVSSINCEEYLKNYKYRKESLSSEEKKMRINAALRIINKYKEAIYKRIKDEKNKIVDAEIRKLRDEYYHLLYILREKKNEYIDFFLEIFVLDEEKIKLSDEEAIKEYSEKVETLKGIIENEESKEPDLS